MAQVQRIVADYTPPVAPRVQHDTVQTPLSTATASGEGLAQLGDTVAKIGQDLAERQIQLQRSTQYNQKSSEAHLAIDDFLRQQEATPYDFTDPDQSAAYEKAVAAGVDKIVSQSLEKVKDPVVRAQLQGDLLNKREHAILRVRDYATGKVIDAGKAQLGRSLTSDINRAIDAGDQVEFTDALNSANDRLSRAVDDGLLSQEDKFKVSQSVLDQVETVRTARRIQQDPVAALHELTDQQVTGTMNPVRRQQLVDTALNEISRRETDNEKIKERQRGVVVTGLVAAASDGQLNPTLLNGLVQPLQLSREEYSAIRSAMDRTDKGGDPAVIQQATIGVNSNNPALRVTQSWLDSHAPQLGGQYGPLSSALRSRSEHEQDKTRDLVRFRHSQAEQNVRESLRFQNPLEAINQASQQTLAQALDELTQRSAAYNGDEDPLNVSQDLIRKYLPTVASAARARANVIRNGLTFKSRTQVVTREQAKARGMSDDQYDEAVHKLADLEKTEAEIGRIQDEIQHAGKGQ